MAMPPRNNGDRQRGVDAEQREKRVIKPPERRKVRDFQDKQQNEKYAYRA
jgi:hypothetical protein